MLKSLLAYVLAALVGALAATGLLAIWKGETKPHWETFAIGMVVFLLVRWGAKSVSAQRTD